MNQITRIEAFVFGEPGHSQVITLKRNGRSISGVMSYSDTESFSSPHHTKIIDKYGFLASVQYGWVLGSIKNFANILISSTGTDEGNVGIIDIPRFIKDLEKVNKWLEKYDVFECGKFSKCQLPTSFRIII